MPDRLSLHLTPHPRRYSVAEESGDVFRHDDDFEGFTLTIELLDEAEADAVLRALKVMMPHWKTDDEVYDG
ncbi:hypothetical protein [Defluviimonas sp. SAOS-178_SWC]|uniref:hypothetical protein n=1 Tax=Defluviimonas sp. SAOS-178_SWC TaxID=3121287 RepID=UPI00322202EE